jgi:hypothetical protein
MYRVKPRPDKPAVFVDVRTGDVADSFPDLVSKVQGRPIFGQNGNKPIGQAPGKKDIKNNDESLGILEGNAKSVCKAVNKIEDVAELKALLKKEKNWKNRKTVVEEIEQQIEQVSG